MVAYDRNLAAMGELEEDQMIRKCTEGMVSNLPFESESFDAIVCRFAFHHFESRFVRLSSRPSWR